MKNEWRTRDWKWLVGILIGIIILILTGLILNIPDVSNYLSILSTGLSIALSLIAIYIALSQNNNSEILNTKTTEMLIRIEEKIGNVKETVDKFDLNEIKNLINTHDKEIFSEFERLGIEPDKIESVKKAVPISEVLVPKIAKISITTPILYYRDDPEGPIGFVTYEAYDQYGNIISCESRLRDNLTFKSHLGNASGANGLVTVRYSKGVSSTQTGIEIITITDLSTGVSTTAHLPFQKF